MAGRIVYLDVDDEITSAAARIRDRRRRRRVAVVLPYGSRVATSRINFRLLAREALTHEKRLSIVAGDAATRALAASAGLPVFASVAEYEAAMARRASRTDRRRVGRRRGGGCAGRVPRRRPRPPPAAAAGDGVRRHGRRGTPTRRRPADPTRPRDTASRPAAAVGDREPRRPRPSIDRPDAPAAVAIGRGRADHAAWSTERGPRARGIGRPSGRGARRSSSASPSLALAVVVGGVGGVPAPAVGHDRRHAARGDDRAARRSRSRPSTAIDRARRRGRRRSRPRPCRRPGRGRHRHVRGDRQAGRGDRRRRARSASRTSTPTSTNTIPPRAPSSAPARASASGPTAASPSRAAELVGLTDRARRRRPVDGDGRRRRARRATSPANAITVVPRGEEPFFLKVTNPDADDRRHPRGVPAGHPGGRRRRAGRACRRSSTAAFDDALGRSGPRRRRRRPSSRRPPSLGEPDLPRRTRTTLVGQEVETFDLGGDRRRDGHRRRRGAGRGHRRARASTASVEAGHELVDGLQRDHGRPGRGRAARTIRFPVTRHRAPGRDPRSRPRSRPRSSACRSPTRRRVLDGVRRRSRSTSGRTGSARSRRSTAGSRSPSTGPADGRRRASRAVTDRWASTSGSGGSASPSPTPDGLSARPLVDRCAAAGTSTPTPRRCAALIDRHGVDGARRRPAARGGRAGRAAGGAHAGLGRRRAPRSWRRSRSRSGRSRTSA